MLPNQWNPARVMAEGIKAADQEVDILEIVAVEAEVIKVVEVAEDIRAVVDQEADIQVETEVDQEVAAVGLDAAIDKW